jgi:hypothetical protein
MPSRSRRSDPPKASQSELTAVPDFADDEPEGNTDEFDRAMRGLVQVPKAELDAALRKERSRKGRRKSGR